MDTLLALLNVLHPARGIRNIALRQPERLEHPRQGVEL